ncbi:MAG: hypothetical protein DRI89_02630 [Bacteroidetes bacterium]|nr:MAG: hypothetical protein DRI89_02630 [Bacteroidota bacterium]
MKKLIILGILLCTLAGSSFAQKTVSGKSKATRIKLQPKYERGLPPNLFVDLTYEDGNKNGILEPNEVSLLKLRITNKGKGFAQGLLIRVKDDVYDAELKIQDGQKIPYIYPDQSIEINIPIKAGFNIKTNAHKLEIIVTEYFGYDMDPAYLLLNTIEYQEPELVFSGLDLIDVGSGTAAIEQDGELQAGEQVKVKIVVQNIGQNVSENTKYLVTSNDKNIYLMDDRGDLGDMGIGEVKEFWITISPNKRVTTTGNLPLYLNLTNTYKRGIIEHYTLPIKLNQKPPEPEIVEVKADIEKLHKQVARFEYTSNRITANIANIIDISQVPHSNMFRPNSVAVIVGIENYKYFAPAPYAVNDAEMMKDYFKQVLGIEKVFIYTDEDVDGYFFDDMFNPDYGELQKAIIKGKTDLFVFYSGHGMPSKDGKNVYLFPADGRVEALAKRGYDINKFYQNLEDLGAKSTTVFIDACFSGVSRATETRETQNLVAMKGVSIKPRIKQPWETNPDFNVFASSSFNETSLGFDPSKTGLFTYYVCAGLQGAADLNDDGKITTGELRDYEIENVVSTSVKILGKQTPVFNGNAEKILTQD